MDKMLTTQSFVAGGDFTIADIILTCVLRELRKNEVLHAYQTSRPIANAAKSGRRLSRC